MSKTLTAFASGLLIYNFHQDRKKSGINQMSYNTHTLYHSIKDIATINKEYMDYKRLLFA